MADTYVPRTRRFIWCPNMNCHHQSLKFYMNQVFLCVVNWLVCEVLRCWEQWEKWKPTVTQVCGQHCCSVLHILFTKTYHSTLSFFIWKGFSLKFNSCFWWIQFFHVLLGGYPNPKTCRTLVQQVIWMYCTLYHTLVTIWVYSCFCCCFFPLLLLDGEI